MERPCKKVSWTAIENSRLPTFLLKDKSGNVYLGFHVPSKDVFPFIRTEQLCHILTTAVHFTNSIHAMFVKFNSEAILDFHLYVTTHQQDSHNPIAKMELQLWYSSCIAYELCVGARALLQCSWESCMAYSKNLKIQLDYFWFGLQDRYCASWNSSEHFVGALQYIFRLFWISCRQSTRLLGNLGKRVSVRRANCKDGSTNCS